MHPLVRENLRSLINQFTPAGGWVGRALEIGAVPSKWSLLALSELRHLDRIGVNIAEPSDFEGFRIIQCNGNDMSVFEDASFDLVLTNATLEHDTRFWLTCSEICRVTKPGGITIIGVPGFSSTADASSAVKFPFNKILRLFGPAAGWDDITFTFKYHGHPYDYYRYSERAVREVFMEGFEVLSFRDIMIPPRFITVGKRLPSEPAARKGP